MNKQKHILLTSLLFFTNFYYKTVLSGPTSSASNNQANANIHPCNDRQTELLEQLLKLIFETEKKRLEEAQKTTNALNVLASLALDEEDRKQAKEKEKQLALKAEQERGFTVTECGITIRDTFVAEFDVRHFVNDFLRLLIINLRKKMMTKLISETLGIPDVILGDIPAKLGYPQAAIYPMTFLDNPWGEYTRKRTLFIDSHNPIVRTMETETNKILHDAGLTPVLIETIRKRKAAESAVEANDPRVRKLEEQNKAKLHAAKTTASLLDAESQSDKITARLEQEDPKVKSIKESIDKLLADAGTTRAKLNAQSDQRNINHQLFLTDPDLKDTLEKADFMDRFHLFQSAKSKAKQYDTFANDSCTPCDNRKKYSRSRMEHVDENEENQTHKNTAGGGAASHDPKQKSNDLYKID